MTFSCFSRKYEEERKGNYPEDVTVIDQKLAHTYKFMFKYEVFFRYVSFCSPLFYISLFLISNGFYFVLLLTDGILKYLLIAFVLLYIYFVFRFIEHCILQFMKEIKTQYALTTILIASVHMFASILSYTYIAYRVFNIEDYIFISLAILEIFYLYYKKKDITKGYTEFPVYQFINQKTYDFKYGSEFFPKLKIKKKRLVEPLLSLLYLSIPAIFCVIMVILVGIYKF